MDILEEVVEASPNAVVVVDADGVIQEANRNVSDVLGYSPAELEGMVVEELLLEEDRDHHVTYREEYVEDPAPRPMGQELDLYGRTQEGEAVPVEISLGPVRSAGELYVIATIADISKRQERARELERQNERLETFASMVSHDLRSPLTVLEGHLELAQEQSDSPHLAAMESQVERMHALIEDLLALAREGDSTSARETVPLDEIAAESWNNVATRNAALHCETELEVSAAPSHLGQILENLFRNAVEHGGEDVTVTVGRLDDGTGFYVEDDGAGLSAEDPSIVFESAYSTSDAGEGLGLHIVQELVAEHGWEITVADGADDGARFEITGV